MDPFWSYARQLLRHRLMFGSAMTMAALSAGGLGAGLLGIAPILKLILAPSESSSQGAELSDLVGGLRDRLHGSFVHTTLGLEIPQTWIDALPRGQFTAVCWVLTALGVLTVLGATANFLHSYLSLTIVSRTVANIRRDAFRRIVHLPLRTVLGTGGTDLISRIVYDTSTLGGGFNALLSKAIAQTTKGLAAMIAAYILHWQLALSATVLAPILFGVINRLGRRIKRASGKALKSQAGLYLAATETLGGLRVVKVHANERAECGRFHRINKEVVRQELKVRTAKALASPLVEALSIIVLGGLTVFAAKLILDHRLRADVVLLVLGSLFVAGAALKPLTGIASDIQQASAAATRLKELMGLSVEPGHDSKLPRLPRHGSNPSRASIEFRGVTLTYPGAAAPSLRDVSVVIPHGQTWAFVGPNGSGKTTLLSLIPRLFDPDDAGSGGVFIDGHDIRAFSMRSLRRQIGVVTQETVLFTGTIAYNIAYGAEGATMEGIRGAARRARAEEFILQKPNGYDTMIGEGGSGLSGGQKQRLAIARAILRDPAILILDEATSMIDADSEHKIAEAIGDFVSRSAGTRERTCLIVAHRLSTVMNADRIVVMDQGAIVDQGSHAELLARCEVYRLIARNQLMPPDDQKAGG